MLEHIKRFLATPVFIGDEDKTRMANVLNTIWLNLMVVLALAAIAALFVFPEKLSSLMVVVVLLSVLLVVRFLMQRGRVRFASVLLVFGLWAGITLLVSLAGGMTSIQAAY